MPPLEWQGARSPYPSATPVHRLFEQWAARKPAAVALLAGARQLTYAELNERANGVARLLVERGVQPGEPVGVCLERGAELIIAFLGILKAGGCYVPLDAAYPPERLRLMSEEAGFRLVLGSRAAVATLPGLAAELVDPAEANPAPAPNLELEPGSESAAYIMFTSGSTGRPKGVAVPHRAIVRLVTAQDYVSLTEDETFLQLAPASFDASTLEIWGPLLNGGRLAMAPAGQLSLEEIGNCVAQMKISAMWLTAGLFNLMVDEQLAALGGLRQLLAGGDALSVPHVAKFARAHPGVRLINGYGPTESTTFACCHTVTERDLEGSSIPIGQPLNNTTVRILTEALEMAAVGEEGELFIGGDGLALGYWRQPERTAEKFVTLEGERYYRTGDRVRWTEAGVIEFLGRLDQQVKVRGYRIELGEIEAALLACPGVLRCVAVACGEGADKELAAYYVGGAQPEELRDALRTTLPAYMVPATLQSMQALPLTPNGKVDRARLPEPASPPSPAEPGRGANELESVIAAIWGEVLGRGPVDLEMNFFDAGGSSLKLVEAHSRLVRHLKRVVAVTAMFQYPTIRALARHLSEEVNGGHGGARMSGAAERARLQREALVRKQLSRKIHV